MGLGGGTRGPLPFMTTVLPPIFIGMAFILSDAIWKEARGYFLGATVRWDGLLGVALGSLCAGLGGVTRGPLPFMTTVLPPIFIGIAFLLSDAM